MPADDEQQHKDHQIPTKLIKGDASIRHAVPNDVPALLASGGIKRVFCNGQRAYALYLRYLDAACGLPVAALPSTSAANAAWSLERLTEAWRVIL